MGILKYMEMHEEITGCRKKMSHYCY